jgi:WD40 repeat protein/uncharacterized caspase-like protein
MQRRITQAGWLLLVALSTLLHGCGGGGASGRRTLRPALGLGGDSLSFCEAPESDDAQASLVIQENHATQVMKLVLSADGRLLASSGMDGTVRVWDTANGLLLRKFRATASPMLDLSAAGNVLAFSADDASDVGVGIVVVDLGTGKELGRLPFAGVVRLSPDGRQMVRGARWIGAGKSGSGIELVDVETGAVTRTFELGAYPDHIAFDATGRRVAVTMKDSAGKSELAVIDVPSWSIARFHHAAAENIWDVAVSGESLAVRTVRDGIHLFRGKTPIAHLKGMFSDMAIAGTQLWTTDADEKLGRWDLATGARQKLETVGLPLSSFVAASADGATLALASKNNLLKGYSFVIQDVASMRTIRSLESRTAEIMAIGMSPDGGELAAGSSQLALTRWSLATGELRSTRWSEEMFRALEYDPRGGRLAYASTNWMMRVLDTASGKLVRQWAPHGQKGMGFAGFLPGTSDLVTGSADGAVTIWDLSDRAVAPPPRGPTNMLTEIAKPPSRAIGKVDCPIGSAALSPDGSLLAIACHIKPRIEIMSLKTGAIVWGAEALFSGAPRIVFTRDGRVLILVSDFQKPGMNRALVKAYDGATGAPRQSMSLTTRGPIAAGRDTILVGGEQPVLLDASSLAIRAKITTQDLKLTAATAHPTRKLFAVGSDSGAISMISEENGQVLAVLVSTSSGEYVAATPEGAYRSSLDGARAIAWTFTDPLEGFPFEQFAARFQRSDIVARRLAGESAPSPGDVRRPPRVCIDPAKHPKTTTAAALPLQARVASGQGVARVRIFVNGRFAAERAVSGKEANVALDVPLVTGQNRISVIAYDGEGYASNPRMLDVVSTAQSGRPDLWVVSVGVSKYENLSRDQQLDVADDDARAITQALSKQAAAGGPFARVKAITLLDAEVTVESVERAIGQLSQMRPDDLAVVFMAGHGVRLKDGKMVFLTSRAGTTASSARQNGIGWDRVQALFEKSRGKILMLLDACHSGHVSIEQIVPNDALAAALAGKDRTGVLVFAASKGAQLSYELSTSRGGARGLELAWDGRAPAAPQPLSTGHGLFTSAVLEALAGEAPDRDRSGAVEVSELIDYVTERVRAASNGKQTPWVARREMFGDFVVAPAKKR